MFWRPCRCPKRHLFSIWWEYIQTKPPSEQENSVSHDQTATGKWNFHVRTKPLRKLITNTDGILLPRQSLNKLRSIWRTSKLSLRDFLEQLRKFYCVRLSLNAFYTRKKLFYETRFSNRMWELAAIFVLKNFFFELLCKWKMILGLTY